MDDDLSGDARELRAQATGVVGLPVLLADGADPWGELRVACRLVGMVTFVGQWWTEARKPPVEDVANHLAALAWMGLRHLPKRPMPRG